MSAVETEHTWFAEHVATYLADGLDGDDRARFASHAATCEHCAAELDRARAIESRLHDLFDDATPSAGFEDRIITRLRESAPMRIWVHPMVAKAAAIAASVALVGGVGYVASRQLAPQAGVSVASNSSTPSDRRNNTDADRWDDRVSTGRVEFQANPFTGIQRDMNVSAKAEGKTAFAQDSAYYRSDSVPSAIDGVQTTTPAPIAGFKPLDFGRQSESEKSNALKLDRPQLAEQLGRAQEQALKDQVVLGQSVQPVAGALPAEPGSQQQSQPPPQTNPVVVSSRKIIRNGQLEFEVDSFDSSLGTIAKIVAEESGYIDTTNSQKLDNGKVKGTVVVRVPPEHLDALVLKLRALGELKRQNLSAQDVSKQYSDLQSELRGTRAMEERLIEIIKTGKGEIKDLLAAEKELAVWRGKLEKIQGEINFYDNQISLSTLSIELAEKNISTAAATTEQENVNIGVETDDVEKSRTEAIQSIDEAKGRVIESELKKLDAGQLASKIVAEVPRESAGLVLDRLKQLGFVARLDIERKQTTSGGEAPAANARVEQKPTRLIISLYNLANVAPRETTNIWLACDGVEATYHAILARVREPSGGRIISSNLNQAEQISGLINFEVKSADAASVLEAVRAAGDVMRLDVTENVDTANVTSAKRGFVLQLASAAQIPPRQTTMLGIETRDVESGASKITTNVLTAGGRVIDSDLSKEPTGRTIARLIVEVPLAKSNGLVNQIKSVGTARAERESINNQIPQGQLARARIELTLATPDAIVSGEHGFWSSIRNGLSTSAAGLMWSLQIIVVGLCFVVPWAIVLWGAWRLFKRTRAHAA